MTIKLRDLLILGLLCQLTFYIFLSLPAQAEKTKVGIIRLAGMVIDPLACTVNQGADSKVSFGNEIITTRIDGVNYMQQVNYTVECTGNVNNLVKMRLEGLGTDFDSKAVLTDNKNIGVAMYIGSTRIGVNEWIKFTYPDKPVIKMAPVKRPNFDLKGGTFSGFVQFKLEYQ